MGGPRASITCTLLCLRCIHNLFEGVFPGGKHVPRRPDPDLEGKILDAAQKLWKKGGEKALTMRTVAATAGTNTPAVYRRFRDRDDVLRSLLQRIRLEIAARLDGIASVEEGCERYLDYALSHPHEYELFFQKQYELFYSARSIRAGATPAGRPVRDIIRKRVMEELGGSDEHHERLLTALLMLVHGAAMLLIAKNILPEETDE